MIYERMFFDESYTEMVKQINDFFNERTHRIISIETTSSQHVAGVLVWYEDVPALAASGDQSKDGVNGK